MSKACILIILAAGLLGCSVGFKKFIWFMSVGYGLAMSCIALALFVLCLATGTATFPFILLCIVLFVYGLRLGLFLLMRETGNAAYRKTLASAGGDKKMPMPVLVSMWLMNAVLFMMQTSPMYYRLQNIANDEAEGGS